MLDWWLNIVPLFCSMYILLRGQVSVYHNYGTAGDELGDDGDVAVANSVATPTGSEHRHQLGSFVVTLKGEQRRVISSFCRRPHELIILLLLSYPQLQNACGF